MLNDLKNIIEALDDDDAGWVGRRDAADALGEIAANALAALHAHADEKDVDVRTAVQKSLARAGVGSGGAAPTPTAVRPTLKELAQACEKKMKRAVKPQGAGFVVRVQTKAGRTQDVFIAPKKREDGRELLRVSTQCGVADDETLAWAIRRNSQLMYCAFSVEPHGDAEHLVIVKNFNPDYVTPAMVKDAVKEIAFYGDWLEKKLSGEDKY